MVEGSPRNLLEKKDFEETEQGKKYYIEKDKFEKPGIELTGYSLIFFKVVEAVLEARKKEFLKGLLPNFLKSCEKILECCSGMSAFEGPWRKREKKKSLSIDEAERFVGEVFFDEMIFLFDNKLEGENLTVAQTEQVLGTFFISSLVKLYGEVMLQGLFDAKLRELAERLRDSPLTMDLAGTNQGVTYISEIFKPNVATADLVVHAQEQFESIFQEVESQDIERGIQTFDQLVTLFFLKPFPFEVTTNARFIQLETESKIYKMAPFTKQLEQRISDLAQIGIVLNTAQENSEPEQSLAEKTEDPKKGRKKQEEERALVIKHAGYVKTAFDAVHIALEIVKCATGRVLPWERDTLREFEDVIKIGADALTVDTNEVEKLNPIFHQYFVAVHARKFQKNDFNDVFEASSVRAKVKQIIQGTEETLRNETKMALFKNMHLSRKMVLVPPAKSVRQKFNASKRNNVGGTTINVQTLEVVPKSAVEYEVHRAEFLKGKRRLICCYPADRETLSALLNANPLVKALLFSQVPIAVVLQILRVDNNFKDVSTVMWFEPVLGLIGFSCGVYALKNPKHLVNPLVRILEALSTSSVVLTKSLGIAILAHTELFPEEGELGGIDIERFLTVVASVPITLALLSWVYNSINPHFKERHFSKRLRFNADLVNWFVIYFGLIQIISIDIVKIMNRIEKIDFSTRSSRILFELLPAIPAPFFAYARVAPIRSCSTSDPRSFFCLCQSCRKSDVYVNVSETINTAVLYMFTTVLLTNLGIELSLADSLPTGQTNFRRVFFPMLVLASLSVICRFARSFPTLYDGNPEVIIKQVIKERGLQPRGNGTFSLMDGSQSLLRDPSVNASLTDADERDIDLKLKYARLNWQEVEALETGSEASGKSPNEKNSAREMLLMRTMNAEKRQQQRRANTHEDKQTRGGSCVML